MRKKCTKCNKNKDLASFPNSKKGKFGKSSVCKKCLHLKKLSQSHEKWISKNLICYICGKPIPFNYFFKSRKTTPVYCSKKCCHKRYKKYQENNKEKLKKGNASRAKKYYWSNREIIKEKTKAYNIRHKKRKKEYDKEYRQKNLDRIKKRNQQYYIKNKDAIKEKTKLYLIKNKDKLANKYKEYYQKNKNKINKYRNSWEKNKEKNDIHFRIKKRLQNRILIALKRNKKSDSTMKLVGCSLQELKQHIEKQFKLGMTWNNYNYRGWHIDHIIPCASFDLSKEEEQKKCFHYTNLQPLWAEENIKKSNKIL